MKPNEIKPEAYENVLPVNTEKVADTQKGFDMCTMQYYCPQPIIGARLAHAYVPFQFLCCLYPPEVGLQKGTIFPELARAYREDPVYAIDE